MFRLSSIKFETAGNSTSDTDNICFILNFNNTSNIYNSHFFENHNSSKFLLKFMYSYWNREEVNLILNYSC